MVGSEPEIVTGGGIRVDYLITREGVAHNRLIGGNAIYSAVGAAIWSKSVAVLSRVGDNYPVEWLDSLVRSGIDISAVRRVPGTFDHRTFFAYRPDGVRDDTNPAKHYGRIGAALPRELEDYMHSTPLQADLDKLEPLAIRAEDCPSTISGVSAVHLAPLPIRSHLELAPFLRERGVRFITIDPGERYMKPDLQQQIKKFLPYLDVFLPSEQEIQTLFGQNASTAQAARTLIQWGCKSVVIKRGKHGAAVLHQDWNELRNYRAFHQASDPTVVDVTGAGDSFCGGFAIGLAAGAGQSLADRLDRAARMGLVSSSYTIEGYGALYPLIHGVDDRQSRLDKLGDFHTFES
ncbi:MAG: carbohydrate kinase family protein [Candidatus Promineifilaceae bacterium]|jgi:ribokinase